MAAATNDEGIELNTLPVRCVVTSPPSDIEEDVEEDVATALPTLTR